MAGGRRTKGIRRQSLPGSPLVSIITVVFNGIKSLEQTILSVLNQDYGNIEYIIVDGGSTDGTLDVVKKYEGRIDYWISERDKGIYDAMNKGIDLAGGELIGALNADDYYESGAVRAVVDAWSSDTSKGIVYGNNYVCMDDLGLRYRNYSSLRFWKGMPICHQAMFVHREVYRSIGKYDLTYKITADLDFLLRAIDKGVKLLPTGAFLVNFRSTGMSTANSYPLLKENKIILRHYFGSFSAPYMAFISFYYRKIFMLRLRRIIQITLGDRFLLKARHLYSRIFISKNKDCV